jgi:hypothetical protein
MPNRTNHNDSPEMLGIVKIKEDMETAITLYADGVPYDLDRIDSEVAFYKNIAGQSLVEIGKRLILVKTHEERGRFLAFLDKHDMAPRSVQYAMAAAQKFPNTQSIAYLGNTKMMALSVLDDEDIQKLDAGGSYGGMTLDDIDRMTTRELREGLRKEKEARKRDREVQEKAIRQKEEKINALDEQLRYRQPATKGELAQAELQSLAPEYGCILARITAALREALAMVILAERVEGVSAQQLSEFFAQWGDIEMPAIHDLVLAWTDEIDDAEPILPQTLSDLMKDRA